jgi:hypothetical protein
MNEPTTAKLRKEWEDDAGGGFDWTEEDVEDLHNKFGILLKRLEAAEAHINSRLTSTLKDTYVFVKDGYRCPMTDEPTGHYERIKL